MIERNIYIYLKLHSRTMPAKIIDGKEIADRIKEDIKSKIKNSRTKPGIALVIVGSNPASQIYVNSKEKSSLEIGFHVERFNLEESVSQLDLLNLVNKLNNNPKIHGILVQLPLPKHIDESYITNSILPHKDVDGFTPINIGNLAAGNDILAPATAKAIINLIESTNTKIEGKHAVVVGRSDIVGKPVALMLLQRNATVTICHSKTKNLSEFTKKADIIVAAVGKPNTITVDMVKDGAVVIDVGINRMDGKIVGDVDFENVKKVAGCITPVPGGVGPMTIAMLMQNTLNAKELAEKIFSE